MKRSWSLFAYPVMDIKAAEAALNRRATVGWRLEKVWLGLLASFVPAGGQSNTAWTGATPTGRT